MKRSTVVAHTNRWITLTFLAFTSTFFISEYALARGSKRARLAPKEDTMPQNSKPATTHVPGQLLVSMNEGTSAERRHEIFQKLGLLENSKVGSTELYLVTVPQTSSLDSIIETLESVPEVRYAEKNMTMKMFKPMNPSDTTE